MIGAQELMWQSRTLPGFQRQESSAELNARARLGLSLMANLGAHRCGSGWLDTGRSDLIARQRS